MKKWTKEEDNFLKNNYDKLKYGNIAIKLNRTRQSIDHRCKHLNIKKINIPLYQSQKKLTPTLSYILGVILGDGSLNTKNGQIKLGVKDKDFAIIFYKNLKKWAKKYVGFYKNNRKTFKQGYSWDVILSQKKLCIFLEDFINNKIYNILKANKKVQSNFL